MRRHILVTGAGGAIGGALARRLRAHHLDASLTLASLDEAGAQAAVAACGQPAVALGCDLSRVEEAPRLLERAHAAHGPIDVLVNCAGRMDMRSLAGTAWEDGERLLHLDLTSPLRLMHGVAASMIERGGGCIINVSSMAGVTPLRGCAFYGAAKAGLAMASEIARLELAPRGVHVVTVYPGPVRSELERNARAQVEQGPLTRLLPTGEAEAIAEQILDAYRHGRGRVVYPAIYRLAHGAPRLAGSITAWLSPSPLR